MHDRSNDVPSITDFKRSKVDLIEGLIEVIG
jgi:hypothetical protein